MKVFLVSIFLGVFLMSSAALASHYNITPSTINSTINPGNTIVSNFRITPGVDLISGFIYPSTPFEISLSENSFVDLGTFRDVSLNISIPKYTLPNIYKSFICVVANESKCVELNINVPRIDNFTTNDKINLTLNSNSKGYFYINLSNSGNSILNTTASSTTNSLLPSNITMHPGLNYTIPVFYTFSSKLGLQQENITIISGSMTKIVNLHFNITDNESPKLVDIRYESEIKTLKTTSISIVATDDINVSYINIFFDKNNTFNLTKISENNYNVSFKLNNTSFRNFTIFIFDTSNNNHTIQYPVVVNRIGGVSYFNYDPVEILRDFEYRKTIFATENELPVLLLSLNSFIMTPQNSSYKMSLSGDNVEKREVKLGEAINLTNVKGNIYLDFVSSNVSTFNGEMIIIPPNYVADNRSIKISGKVGDFNVFESKNITIEGKVKVCTLKFTGDLYNSTYICSEEFPVTYNFNDIKIDMSERDFNEIKGRANAERDLFEAKFSSANMWKWIFFSLLLFYLIFSFLYYRFKTRRGFFVRRFF